MRGLKYFGPPPEERFKKGSTLDRDHDTSQLLMKTFQHQPHKDYLGHVFRWGFVGRMVNRKSRVLDAGCGTELPMMLALGGSNPNTVPEIYVGVDLNPIPDPPKRKWGVVLPQTDLALEAETIDSLYGPFNLVVSLEVYEHIAPGLALDYLRAIRAVLAPGGRLVLSTPVYCHSFKMARNHVNERTKAEMEDDLHYAGFNITHQYGTFGNYRDFKKHLTAEELFSYEEQRAFYGDDVLGCYLAPRFPEASRNVTHVCVRDDEDEEECELRESIV